MNGQFLMNKAITVQYAFKKDGKGERHGTSAERLLATQARKNNALPLSARPPAATGTLLSQFGVRPPMAPAGPMPGVPPVAYQPGQYAGVFAAPPPPPPGFAVMGGMPPPPPPGGIPMMGMPGVAPPPPAGFVPGPMATPVPGQPMMFPSGYMPPPPMQPPR
jgi:splicing factor 3B subunit 4